MPPCVCAQACVTFCASMHTHAFKGEHCPSCKYAHICKCLLSQQATHTHKIPLNACTHTSSTQGCLSSEFSDPSERRTNTLMDSLCLRDAFEFLPSSLFPFPLSLFFPLPSRHLHKGAPIPRIHQLTTFERFLAARFTLTKARAHVGG